MLQLLLAIWFWWGAGVHAGASSFDKAVKPILEHRCQPCHFAGGKMYERLPFDQPATIVKLGTKLFTRIRDEHERDVIRTFLANEEASAARRHNERGRDKRL